MQQRRISRLTRDTMAFVLAGGRGSRLYELTDFRCKPAVFFGGKFRIIDFTLSNCVNSGIRRIAVLTQYRSHSLIDHIVRGWTQFHSDLNEFVQVLPASQQTRGNWYSGTADAVFQNLDIIEDQQPEYVIILSGDHVYKMDFGRLLADHVDNQADVTVACLPVPLETAAGSFGVMSTDHNGRIIAFTEKPAHPDPMPDRPGYALASMGNYVFKREVLLDILNNDDLNADSSHDFGRDVLPRAIDRQRVFAYPFLNNKGEPEYWRDVGTLDAYWSANMDLVSVSPELNLYDKDWPVLSHQAQLPPAKFVFDQDRRRGHAVDSVVSGGCIISGAKIRRSLLFSGVTCHSYSNLDQVVALPDTEIGRHCRIRRAIIDKGCRIPAGTTIGLDHQQDIAKGFRVTDAGIVLVTPRLLGQSHYHFEDRRQNLADDYHGRKRRLSDQPEVEEFPS